MAGHRLLRGPAGPAYCVVCGGFVDHDLPSECPQRVMFAVEMVNVADGKLNLVNNNWVWHPDIIDATMSQVVYH